ncbi:atos homolog protein B [Anolis sagrei]|uniref:atos homolog protein B n=1 Tax=Anolis sagrei TaxID=38937 RepID=UPI0035224BE1
MRHINTESALPQECRTGTSREDEEDDDEEDEEGEEEGTPCPWRRPHGVLMGRGPPELTCQKVYQVSIFSPLAGCSHPLEHRAPGRQPVKRPCPEPQRPAEEGEWDAKRGLWEGDDGIEDGLLVDDLPLGGSAQHFSHSGLRVVEHRREGSPGRPCGGGVAGPARTRGGHAAATSDDSATALHGPRTSCDTLHTKTRDCAPPSPGGHSSASGYEGGSGGGSTPHLSRHRLLLDPDLHNLAHPAPPGEPDGDGHTQPSTSETLAEHGPGTSPGLGSAEKTPCSSARLLGGNSRSCPAKRKLLPATEGGAETGSEDEGPPPVRKKRTPHSPAVPTSCRSTDAKGAPFWNHLLPAAKGSTNSGPGNCQLKTGLRLKQRSLRSSLRRASAGSRSPPSPWATTSTSRALLGNFEESMLKGRFPPSGRIEGFTAEIGASGSYCPQHATLPVEVTYFDIAEHSAPSPFLGVIDLEALGKKGYSIPKTGTIQVTLFNPNKTVVKMFLVTYDFHDMPANHITFLRHRIFLVPVEEEQGVGPVVGEPPRRVLCYLMHLRFHSSKSGKIYLHDNIRLLFSRKSIEIDSGIPYELKSFTELPRNPCYSPRA